MRGYLKPSLRLLFNKRGVVERLKEISNRVWTFIQQNSVPTTCRGIPVWTRHLLLMESIYM